MTTVQLKSLPRKGMLYRQYRTNPWAAVTALSPARDHARLWSDSVWDCSGSFDIGDRSCRDVHGPPLVDRYGDSLHAWRSGNGTGYVSPGLQSSRYY